LIIFEHAVPLASGFQKPWLMTRDLLLGLRMTEGPKGFGFGF
jgi:hypothetical protein